MLLFFNFDITQYLENSHTRRIYVLKTLFYYEQLLNQSLYRKSEFCFHVHTITDSRLKVLMLVT